MIQIDNITNLKNILIQYKGGGYDGCIWEWNFAYIDGDKTFHSIYNSGIDGKNNLKDLLIHIDTTEYYIYDLDDGCDVNEFINECNDDNVLVVANWLFKNMNIILHRKCNKCNKEFKVIELSGANYVGNGGIGIIATSLICEDCNID